MDSHNFAAGQQPPRHPASQPLALRIQSFAPTRVNHPPPGTVPDEIVPEGEKKPLLFEPKTMHHGGLKLKNSVVVSPMCQYSAVDGFPTPYHIAHLGSFALHGAGTIMVEASGVVAEGRITPQDLGIWKDEHIAAHASLCSALKSFTDGLTVGIQLAHAGRKSSTWSPFHRGERKQKNYVTDSEGGWEQEVFAPSAIAYDHGHLTPKAMTLEQIKQCEDAFVKAAERAFEAGYDFVELHAAHGYLLHSFLSPLSNQRTDAYGGSPENRARLLIDISKRIHSKFPSKSLWVRVSSTDYAETSGKESWDISGTTKLAPLLEDAGVDVLDCSAGGLVPFQKIDLGPAYQLPYAAAVKELGLKKMLVASVGMLEGEQGRVAEKALQEGKADLVLLARGFMNSPSWIEEAAVNLMGTRCAGNPQYHRVHPAKRPQH